MKGFKKRKDDSNMNIHRGILGCVFVGCEGPCRDGSCNPCVCSHGNGSIWGVSMNGRGGTWQTSISLLLGKHSKRLCVRNVGHGLTDEPFKEDFWSIQEKLLHPNQDLQQAGFRLSGRPWMWNRTSSQRNHTNHKFITQHKSHKSHPSDSSSHWHPPLMGWYSAPLLQCKSSGSRYDAHCMPFTRPYGTCCIVVKIWQKGILEITTAMILLVSWIRWQ